ILPVHLYGNPCDMDALSKIAESHHIALLEDATESLGGTWRGKPTGTLGDFGCFSFNGNKLITTGGGGMVVGKDRRKMNHIRFLVNQARDTSRGYFHSELGYNYRMTNLEASLGLAQMERIEELLTKKIRFAAIYRETLQDLPEVAFQKEPDGGESAWWLSSFTYTGGPIAEVQETLKERGIPTRRLFSPLSRLPYLKGFNPAPCPQVERIYEEGLNLPSSTVNNEKEVIRAAETLREILLERRRGSK
ncbi:MAG: DegT/DnrJ/EryC1/StrS family aminotransferase, partial [Synergistaceae bacterium]|nr:DegT/DnrJ/EryC1/StrS family aminotransferase [Synergistaceae bacterium]